MKLNYIETNKKTLPLAIRQILFFSRIEDKLRKTQAKFDRKKKLKKLQAMADLVVEDRMYYEKLVNEWE